MAPREKKGPSGEVETKTVSYLPAGVGVVPERGPVTLDPELEKARDAEMEKLANVPSRAPLGEPTIDPALVKIRDAEIKRDADRAKGVTPAKSAAPAPTKAVPAKKSSK
jgi:hypothetical protein